MRRINATIQLGAIIYNQKHINITLYVNRAFRVHARIIKEDITVTEIYYINTWWTVDTKYVSFDAISTV